MLKIFYDKAVKLKQPNLEVKCLKIFIHTHC